MESILNLIWLMLALPLFLLWRQARRSATVSGPGCRTNAFVLVGCLLVLLFPVISATDDVQASRFEMEEASAGKSLTKHSAGLKVSMSGNDAGSPTLLRSVALYAPGNRLSEPVPTYAVFLPPCCRTSTIGGRAPPFSKLPVFVAPPMAARFIALNFMLKFLDATDTGLQRNSRSANASSYGLHSLECEIHPLTASGNFPAGQLDQTRIRRQPRRDPVYPLENQEGS